MRAALLTVMALYLIGQVWYWGFSEGWSQAVAAAAVAPTVQTEPAVGPVPLPS